RHNSWRSVQLSSTSRHWVIGDPSTHRLAPAGPVWTPAPGRVNGGLMGCAEPLRTVCGVGVRARGAELVYPASAGSRQMSGQWYEDLEVGKTYRHPITRTVTESDNILFSCLTMNPQPLHI